MPPCIIDGAEPMVVDVGALSALGSVGPVSDEMVVPPVTVVPAPALLLMAEGVKVTATEGRVGALTHETKVPGAAPSSSSSPS